MSPVDAERIIKGGGCRFNFRKITNPQAVLIPGEHILPSAISLIRIGRFIGYIRLLLPGNIYRP